MKILQLNIWGGRLENQIVDLLKREDADIVCLQEVIAISGAESFFFMDMEELQSAAEYEYAYHSSSHTFNYMRRRASWGNCVLSRFPFERTEYVYTYEPPLEDFDFLEDRDYNLGRVLQHVVVGTENGPLHVLNHHGYHIHGHKDGDDETMKQCGMIAEYVKDLDGDVVLCGDFNLAPDSASLEQINTILTNHTKTHHIVSTRTQLTKKTEACDYIFTSPNLQAENFRVLDDIVSDHEALTIEVY